MAGGILAQTFRYVGLTLAGLYFVLPILVRLIPGFAEKLIFLAFISNPFVRFDNPAADHNLTASRNFYLEPESGIRLGVWQLLPHSHATSWSVPDSDSAGWERALSDIEKPIFLYLHGNAFNRAALHRIELYGLLAEMDFHVVAFDYRGFGDSMGTPSAAGLVSDSKFLYNWLRRRAGANPIYVWGHSLGTAVATELGAQLQEQKVPPPAGIILEAPFNNLDDAVRHHPIALPLRVMPWFDWLSANPIAADAVAFASDARIRHIRCPLLILHAEDDHVVPFELGLQLYRVAVEKGVDAVWYEFESHHAYEHKHICRAPELPKIVNDFVSKCTKKA